MQRRRAVGVLFGFFPFQEITIEETVNFFWISLHGVSLVLLMEIFFTLFVRGLISDLREECECDAIK